MIVARVIGSVVANVQTDWIENPVYRLVQEIDDKMAGVGSPLVALDLLGVANGEVVLISQGSSARQNDATKDRPVDAVVAGIVDLVERGGRLVYNKGEQ